MLRTSLSSSKPKLPKWAELPSNSDNRSKILTGFMIEKGQASDGDRTRDKSLEGSHVTATPHPQIGSYMGEEVVVVSPNAQRLR